MKTNDKLIKNYAKVLENAFTFCRENKRKSEFKRLCDSVRGYLQTLIKTEKVQVNFTNKVDISKPEILLILIKMRMNLLDTAIDLEHWQESFKTSEDIIYLMERYERSSVADAKSKKNKITTRIQLDFYRNILKLLWVSNYYLFHANCSIVLREHAISFFYKSFSLKKNAKNEDISIIQTYLDYFNIKSCNERIILSMLTTPVKQSSTAVKIGNITLKGRRNEEVDYESNNESETCIRMMSVLKQSTVPCRKLVKEYIENNHLLDDCSEDIVKIYRLFEEEVNPILIAREGLKLIKQLSVNEEIKKYCTVIKKNLVIKCLILMRNVYENITFERLSKIFNNEFEFESLENLIIENTKEGILTCSIDHSKNLIRFKNKDSEKIIVNQTIDSLMDNVERISINLIKDKQSKKIIEIKNVNL